MIKFMNFLAESSAYTDPFYEKFEEIFSAIVNYAIILIELIGTAILVIGVIKAVIGIFKKTAHLRLDLAESIALSLEFKMGGELLRTVIVRNTQELIMLGAIVLLRAAMTFLIQWEIKLEKKEAKEKLQELIEKNDK